jgi:hypothetical protein
MKISKTKLIFGLSIAVMVLAIPIHYVLAQSINIYGFGFESWEGRINPWPWSSNGIQPPLWYPGQSFSFQYIPVMGNFNGYDSITVDCYNDGTNIVTTGGSSSYTNVWGQMEYYDGGGYATCNYAKSGTFSPHIHVVRTGDYCYYSGYNYVCQNTGQSASTDDYPGGIQIVALNYGVNIYPSNVSMLVRNAPINNVSFTANITLTQCGGSGCFNNPVGGSFPIILNCGNGAAPIDTNINTGGTAEVNTQNYNSSFQPIGGSGVSLQDAFSVGSCSYPTAGIYQPSIVIGNGNGSGNYATVVALPSGPPSVTVTASPNYGTVGKTTSGTAESVSLQVDADAEGILPATGVWGPVELLVSCGEDGQIDGSYNINFNTAGTPMSSSLVHDFTCTYSAAGTYTPTVTVEQNGLSASGSTKVILSGQLACGGTTVETAPANYVLSWDAENADNCTASTLLNNASYSGVDNFSGPQQAASSSFIFSNVPAGNYEYELNCIGTDAAKTPVTGDCKVDVQ